MTEEIIEKKANHRAPVVLITENMFRPHPDPETTNLVLIDIGGYQVVSRKDSFKPGDLGVYIQPDSVVPQTEPFKFIWETYVGLDGTVPEKRRRITVKKLRGQWSEGLLMPLSDFNLLIGPHGEVYQYLPAVGEDISDRIGVTHYDPDAGKESTAGETVNAPRVKKSKRPKTFKGWFFYILSLFTRRRYKVLTQEVGFHIPIYDVEGFKNYKDALQVGETVVMTEKIHGSNARFICLDGVIYVGSRNQWKAPGTDTVWHKALEQNPWIEEWLRKYEGYALYGEVTPTQAKFDYGCKKGEVKFFVFDIYTQDNKWVDFNDFLNYDFRPADSRRVPFLYLGPFDKELLAEKATGNSMVPGAGHIREGVVTKPIHERSARGLGRIQLKLVSNKFLEVDGKI